MMTIDEINKVFAQKIENASNKNGAKKEEADETQIIKRDFEMNEIQTAETKSSAPKKPKKKPLWKDLLYLFIKIASIILIFIFLFTFMFGITVNNDPAMEPAIKDGDLVFFYRYNSKGYMPQDVIALKINGKTQIRRVIAVEGDTVDITEDGLLINGSVQQEWGIYRKTERYKDGVDFPLTVPEGEVFVLGDNRTNSEDSRMYSTVKISDTLGKVMTLIRRRGI